MVVSVLIGQSQLGRFNSQIDLENTLANSFSNHWGEPEQAPHVSVVRTSCRKPLPAHNLRVLASCAISKLSSLPARALISWCQGETRTMNSLPQQGLARMETIAWVAKASPEDGESTSSHRMSCMQSTSSLVCSMNSRYKPSRCDVPVGLLQLSPEDGKLTGLHMVPLWSRMIMTQIWHHSMLASAENEEVILGGNRDRSWTNLPDCFIVQCCEVLEYTFSVIASGVICVLKLCYAPGQTHILMTCTCNCSMHADFSTCSMHISAQVMQLLHAHSARATVAMLMQLLHAHLEPACTRSGSPHNVLHSPSLASFLERVCS